MQWLRAHCDPIGPDALVERSRSPRRTKPAVLVTFDDGYRSYHDLAYPVLKRSTHSRGRASVTSRRQPAML